MMSSTQTRTLTYTVIDIRKTFEGFDADLRMIARRTGKWDTVQVDNVVHDILKLAEAKYLSAVNIVLLQESDGSVVRASKYTVNEDGKTQSTQRPGENDWTNIAYTSLAILTEYNLNWLALGSQGQQDFQVGNQFKINWSLSQIDTTFSHLSSQSGQLYASSGYELQKKNYR
ncbi:hypothetical protein QWY86_05355 [Pedobacter aquatilis]|uniref:HORMA-1 domain-containing protein n=1 Tax=Pedobacter aquatilis TaxID=351343 RepID=UPI0025B544E5|nr:hypothetical protein [Pedobacter aquatilis]MDN3586083.1 hypothetical protein [Pedobacter aquatilis]